MKLIRFKLQVCLVLGYCLIIGATGETITGREDRPVVVFLGDSLTVGYNLDPSDGYVGVLREKIRVHGYFNVINAGISGDTTAGGLSRIDWLFKRLNIEVLVVILGSNDALRGYPPEQAQTNLVQIIKKARTKNPEIKIFLAALEAPRNMGSSFVAAFRNIFPDIARSMNVELIPFLLDGVALKPELNLPDGIHPNKEGHRIVARNVWKTIGPWFEARSHGSKPGGDTDR